MRDRIPNGNVYHIFCGCWRLGPADRGQAIQYEPLGFFEVIFTIEWQNAENKPEKPFQFISSKNEYLNVSFSLFSRTFTMVVVTIFCIIPLCMLRNIESLSAICISSILFYFCLVLKVYFNGYSISLATRATKFSSIFIISRFFSSPNRK